MKLAASQTVIIWFIFLFVIAFLIQKHVYPLFLQPIISKIGESIYVAIKGDQAALFLISFMTIIIIIPIAEELLCRGIIMETYFKNFPYWLDVIVSTLIFTIRHLHYPWSWNDFLLYLTTSWILPVLYKKTNTIYLFSYT